MDKPLSFTSIFNMYANSDATPVGINAREKAYWIIRDKIIYMGLKPGEPVSDKILAEQLQMSRTPVREALILLSAYNMVIMKPQIGTFVAPINAEWLAMEQFSRLTMEKEIIRQVCNKKDSELYANYNKNLERFAKIKRSDSPNHIRKLHELDNRFHSLAFASCGRLNSFLHMHSYMQHIERLRVLALMEAADGDILKDHSAIASAVMEQDERTAIRCLENHLSIYIESLEKTKSKNPEYFILG